MSNCQTISVPKHQNEYITVNQFKFRTQFNTQTCKHDSMRQWCGSMWKVEVCAEEDLLRDYCKFPTHRSISMIQLLSSPTSWSHCWSCSEWGWEHPLCSTRIRSEAPGKVTWFPKNPNIQGTTRWCRRSEVSGFVARSSWAHVHETMCSYTIAVLLSSSYIQPDDVEWCRYM